MLKHQRYEATACLSVNQVEAEMLLDAVLMAQSVAGGMSDLASECNSDFLFREMRKRWQDYGDVVDNIKKLQWVAEARPGE